LNQEEFTRHVTALQNRMYRIACAYLRGEHDRLDAISQAILRAWEKQAGLRHVQYFDTWLIRILIRECIAIQRKQARLMPVETLPDAPTEDNHADISITLREALDALPEKLRIVIVLYYMEGLSVSDVSRALRISVGAVCSRLSRGRDQLRELLKEEIE
jgi:RNA polymerase sigma-70 factor, ECF subfamily